MVRIEIHIKDVVGTEDFVINTSAFAEKGATASEVIMADTLIDVLQMINNPEKYCTPEEQKMLTAIHKRSMERYKEKNK